MGDATMRVRTVNHHHGRCDVIVHGRTINENIPEEDAKIVVYAANATLDALADMPPAANASLVSIVMRTPGAPGGQGGAESWDVLSCNEIVAENRSLDDAVALAKILPEGSVGCGGRGAVLLRLPHQRDPK